MKIFVIGLQKGGKLALASLELIEAAKSVGGEITSVIMAENAQPLAEEMASRGGGKVLSVSAPQLANMNEEIYTKVLSKLITDHAPDLVLAPATFYGKALLCRLAAKNGGSMVSDITGLAVEGDELVATRSSYGGSVVAKVTGKSGQPLFATVRPKIFAESASGAGEVVVEEVDSAILQSRSEVKEVKVESSGAVSLTEADVIVSAGRGIKGTENLPMIEALAESLGAAVGASRAVVDAGWAPYSYQVGQTGKTVNPKLYVAVAISGAIQHLVGMRTSGTIVAINKDKDAPIFNVSSYGIVGDAFEIVPALTNKFKAELG